MPFTGPRQTDRFLTLDTIDLVVVEIETDTGIIGTGHHHPLAGGLRTIATCIDEMLKPRCWAGRAPGRGTLAKCGGHYIRSAWASP
ncbi:MAG: hypothetical protein R3E68_21670 [Burkholderiaceae bacterium]